MNAMWKCPQCEAERRWKGWCRDCTAYNESGIPEIPVMMEKVAQHDCCDTDSCSHKPVAHSPLTKEMFLNSRRRKLTKKQVKEIEEIAKAKALVPQVEAEGDFVEIGKTIGGDEE